MGGIEPDAITFDLCTSLVDHYITVTEKEIMDSLIKFIDNQHMLIEGAAAVSVAAYLKTAQKLAGMNVVIVICGANVSAMTLKQVLSKMKSPAYCRFPPRAEMSRLRKL
jgi:threonine dehydratase